MDVFVLADQQELCADTGCSLADLPGVMDDKDGWKKKVEESMLSARLDDDDDDKK